MRKARILIAHSNPTTLQWLRAVAESDTPSEVRGVSEGLSALEVAQEWLPDLLILEANLPHSDGFEVCSRLRRIAPFTEVPLLIAFEGAPPEERHRAYLAGADELLDLPCEPLELGYRLKAHLRRRRLIPSAIRGPGIQLDPRMLTAIHEGRRLELTPSEYAILNLLVSRNGTLVSIDSILVEALGAAPRLGNPQVVHTHIRNLRRKLEGDPTLPQHLQSRRNGYWWA